MYQYCNSRSQLLSLNTPILYLHILYSYSLTINIEKIYWIINVSKVKLKSLKFAKSKDDDVGAGGGVSGGINGCVGDGAR